MSKPTNEMPRDAAQLVLWSKGMNQPTAFLVKREEADAAVAAIADGSPAIKFSSYPDGSGRRSDSVFLMSDLRGVTIEYPTIQLMRAH